ncbi:MAG: hypothetical protein RLZZ628_710 [Bacteroidota bacterium]|jgi:uncharacterized protein (DUF58 family)
MKKLFLLYFIFLAHFAKAQKESRFKMTLSEDTIGLNGSLEMRLTLENAQARKFNPPNLDGFEVQGPSQSTSVSIVNGDMSQISTYTYYLKPKSVGVFKIGAATVATETGELASESKQIVVLEKFESSKPKSTARQRNPFGFNDSEDAFDIFQRAPNQQRGSDKKPARKKYEVEKI